MNRKDFFKKLGIGIATIVVAPKVLAEIKESQPTGKLEIPKDKEWSKKWAEEIYQKWHNEQCSTYAPWDYDDLTVYFERHGLRINDIIDVENKKYMVSSFDKKGSALLKAL